MCLALPETSGGEQRGQSPSPLALSRVSRRDKKAQQERSAQTNQSMQEQKLRRREPIIQIVRDASVAADAINCMIPCTLTSPDRLGAVLRSRQSSPRARVGPPDRSTPSNRRSGQGYPGKTHTTSRTTIPLHDTHNQRLSTKSCGHFFSSLPSRGCRLSRESGCHETIIAIVVIITTPP